MLKILSLFDGISVTQQATKELGRDYVYYASEIDKYAIQVAKKNYPDTIQIGDVRRCSYSYARGSIVDTGYRLFGEPSGDLKDTMWRVSIDLLIGGSPCTDLSIAKKDRKGLEGEKSSLFREYARILKEVKPKRFVFENVASMPKNDKDVITKELGVEPIMINAALLSAQTRKRLFRTNIPGVTQPKDAGILLRDILETDRCEKDKSNTVRSSGRGSGSGDKHNRDQYIVQRARGFNKGGEYHEKTPTLSSCAWQENNKLCNGKEIRKLTTIECERLQSLPDNYTDGVSNTQRYKMLGNAFNCAVIKHILSFMPGNHTGQTS